MNDVESWVVVSEGEELIERELWRVVALASFRLFSSLSLSLYYLP